MFAFLGVISMFPLLFNTSFVISNTYFILGSFISSSAIILLVPIIIYSIRLYTKTSLIHSVVSLARRKIT